MTEEQMNESTAKLVAALEEVNQDGALDAILAEARDEKFHDFHANGYDLPQVELLKQLSRVRGRRSDRLRDRVIDGDFDATAAESEAWATSPEGQAIFAELARGGRSRPGGGRG